MSSEPFIDETRCPCCGTMRLVRRRQVRHQWQRHGWGRQRKIVLVKRYVCELCGHTWHTAETVASE